MALLAPKGPLVGLGDIVADRLNSLFHAGERAFVECFESTLECCSVWKYVVGVTTRELADGKDDILARVNVSRFDGEECGVYSRCSCYWITDLVRSRPMASLPFYCDF